MKHRIVSLLLSISLFTGSLPLPVLATNLPPAAPENGLLAGQEDVSQAGQEGEPTGLTPAQQAFVEAVSVLDQQALLALAAAYRNDPAADGPAEKAFFAAYDQVEGVEGSALSLYEALPEESQAQVATSYAALQEVIAAVQQALQNQPGEEAGLFSTGPVPYQDAAGHPQTKEAGQVTSLNENATVWENGWYLAEGTIAIEAGVEVKGTVHLILGDGASLTAAKGISLPQETA